MSTTAIDLSIFDLDFDPDASVPTSTEIAAIVCAKCKGTGNFVGYSGRVVGPCFSCKGTGVQAEARGEKPSGAAVDVTTIVTAFDAARSNGIKSPKLRMGDGIVFSRAPDTGKNPGAIYVKCFGDYTGKIANGRFLPRAGLSEATIAQVVAVASDPHKAAVAYGMRTGSCSCCGRELTNGLSIDLGIGPICREKFGW